MKWLDSAISCPHCGARHEYKYADDREHGSGQQDCLACGKELTNWIGLRKFADFKLVKAAT
jgi:DNA-directed RNA polymerase subunit RPC12/RpoP